VVKSNVKPMPKARRKVEVDPELRKKYLDLLERARETDRKTAELLADVNQFQKYLRERYALR
jgi:hypothetical protein